MSLRRGVLFAGFVLAQAGPALVRPAAAGDITAFLSEGRPSEVWDRGYGAALSFSLFRLVVLEGEAARMPAVGEERDMTSFTASALLALPAGKLTPYGGLGVGLFRQTEGSDSDTGTLRALIVGAKLTLGGLVVLKAEYRNFELSGEPLLQADSRISVGAGISF
jgi:hypothetical protein